MDWVFGWIAAATFLACTGCPGISAPRLCSSNVGRSVSLSLFVVTVEKNANT
jgi:hypothetical protein